LPAAPAAVELQAPPEDTPPVSAAGDADLPSEPLRRLRASAQAWLARDLAPEARPTHRAYADLFFAFGEARSGKDAAAGELLKDATAVLRTKDPVHRCLLAGYTYRIEQALAGRPHAGPLPAQVFEPLGAAPDRFVVFKVERMRDWSRILEPQELHDAYRPWRKPDGELAGQLVSLYELDNAQVLESRIRKVLKTVQEPDTTPETQWLILRAVLPLGPRVGQEFSAELLQAALPTVRDLRPTMDAADQEKQAALLEAALLLAEQAGPAELAHGLADAAMTWVEAMWKRQQLEATEKALAQVVHTLRRRASREQLARLVDRTSFVAGNEQQLREVRKQAGPRWHHVLRVLLYRAAAQGSTGQARDADLVLAEARAILFGADGAGQREQLPGFLTARLAVAYVTVICASTPDKVVDGLAELFAKMEKLSDTFTTNSHYSRSHLMVLEAALLGWQASRE